MVDLRNELYFRGLEWIVVIKIEVDSELAAAEWSAFRAIKSYIPDSNVKELAADEESASRATNNNIIKRSLSLSRLNCHSWDGCECKVTKFCFDSGFIGCIRLFIFC